MATKSSTSESTDKAQSAELRVYTLPEQGVVIEAASVEEAVAKAKKEAKE